MDDEADCDSFGLMHMYLYLHVYNRYQNVVKVSMAQIVNPVLEDSSIPATTRER